MPIDINTNLLAPRQPQNTIPRQDFAAIGQLPAIYRQGQLRQGLAKLAPDDFQGMAKLLMQYGNPEQGVQAMQLGSQLAHQRVEEDLARKSYELQAEQAGLRGKLEVGEYENKLALLREPFNAVLAGIPGFAKARDTIGSSAGPEVASASLAQARVFAHKVARAMGYTGKDEEDYVNNVIPSGTDWSTGAKLNKLAILQSDAEGVAQHGVSLGVGKDVSEYTIPPFAKVGPQQPPAPPGPPTAYNQQPEAANAGERPTVSVPGVPVPPLTKSAIKDGVTPGHWAVMTPEQRALWP